jgi:uncharacterized SAM-dependent methyltransferase
VGLLELSSAQVWNIASHDLLYITPQLAQGFLNLRKIERYKLNVIDREIALLKHHVPKHFGGIIEPFNLIDLGCGDGLKAEAVIRSLPASMKLRYCPVDINKSFLDMASKKIEDLNKSSVLSIKPVADMFENLGEIAGMLRNARFQKNAILFLGNTLASYEINDFLFEVSRDLFKGDLFVIGNGIREGKRFVELDKYRHPAFNSWFMHLIRLLGFSDSEVAYDVRFANSRLEFFYKLLVDKTIEHNGTTLEFKKGDLILVAYQYKYFEKELQKFCKMYFYFFYIHMEWIAKNQSRFYL